MNATWFTFDAWLLHSAIGGSLLLLICWGAMKSCRQPAWRQRLGEWGLAGALLLSVLSLIPAWLIVPVLPTEPTSGAAHSSAPFPAPLSSPASALERNFAPRPQPHASPGEKVWDRAEGLVDDNALAMARSPEGEEATNLLSVLALPSADGPNPAAETAVPPAANTQAATASARVLVANIVTGLEVAYCLAVAVFLARWLFGHWMLGNLLRCSRPAPRSVARLFRRMARGHRQRPRLLVCPRIRMPVSCGLLRPMVLIPSSFCQPEASRCLPWVFAHELTHLERRDALACFLFGLGQALYFYVPWFWSLRRQVRLCQEYVADAVAAQHAGEREDYAQFLLTLVGQPGLPLCTNGVSGYSSDLYRRVTMLLDSKVPTEKCCPRWWSLSAAGVLLAMAVLVSGVGLRARAAAPQEPSAPVITITAADDDEDQAPPKEKSKKKSKKAESSDEDDSMPSVNTDKLQREIEKMQQELKKMHEQLHLQVPGQAFRLDPLPKVFQGQFGPGNAFRFVGPHTGRLGIEAQPPSATLVDQLNLPKGEGLDIVEVAPDSAAAKAGLKAHDILLELDGKAVPSDVGKFVHALHGIKAKTPVEAVVLRRGKRVTIEGISLPEAKAEEDAFQGQFQQWPKFPQGGQFINQPFAFSPKHAGADNVAVTVNSKDGHLTLTRIEGSLVISVTGNMEDKKMNVTNIKIHNGEEADEYTGIEDVPEKYRAKVQGLVDMTEKGKIKIEKKSSKKKTKGDSDDDEEESEDDDGTL
jgi:beta-lactamase regulating signal transducer with metallopeptidase domain